MGFLDKLLGKGKKTASDAADKAAPVVERAADKTADLADQAGDKASDLADRAKADDATPPSSSSTL
jgi:hypothetical protein